MKFYKKIFIYSLIFSILIVFWRIFGFYNPNSKYKFFIIIIPGFILSFFIKSEKITKQLKELLILSIIFGLTFDMVFWIYVYFRENFFSYYYSMEIIEFFYILPYVSLLLLIKMLLCALGGVIGLTFKKVISRFR